MVCCQNSGIMAKITNHSIFLRKTLCQILYSAHTDPTVIIQLSGHKRHKNFDSVLNYASADMDQQQDMSEILSNTTARKRRPEKPRELPPSPQKAAQTPSPSLDDPGVFEVEETPQKVAKMSHGHSMAAPLKQARETEFERVVKSASGLLSNATVNGDVKITINYNVCASSQVSSTVTVSPKLPLPQE